MKLSPLRSTVSATLWMSGIDFIQGNLVQQADEDMNFDFNQAVL